MSNTTFNKEYLGFNGFIWWMGVVEDINDPLKTGRVKVRCLEWHTEDKNEVPTDHLPWAQVMMPVNSSSNSGVGQSPTGIQNGSWVVGFFLDGRHGQRPMVMGTIPGIPMTDANPKLGFNDPDGKYPTLPKQPDTNRLARNDEKYQHPNVQTKNDSKKTDVLIANKSTSWDEPSSAYSAEYPQNDVYEGSGGVIREYDNTPGNERIHHYHPSGSFAEYNALGNHHQRVANNNFTIVAGKDFVYIKGDANLTVDGNCHTYIKGNWDVFVGGYKKEVIGGNLTQMIGQDLELTTGGDINMKAGGNMDLLGARIDLNKGAGGLFGGLLGSVAGYVAGGILSDLAGSLMEEIGNIGEVISVDAISEIGPLGTGYLPGGPKFMGITDSLRSTVSSGFDVGSAFGDAFSSAASSVFESVPSVSLSSLSDVGLSTVSRGLDITNVVKSSIKPIISFASSNLDPSSFLGNVGTQIAGQVQAGVGDLSKSFDSIGDFQKTLTSNINIQKVLGSAGADVVSKAVGNMFDPANDLNGFKEDIFAGNTLGDVKQKLFADSELVPANLINKQFDVNVQELFNAKSLIKSVAQPDFANLELTDKISSALELESIVENTLGKQESFVENFSSKQLLSTDGLKQQALFDLENRVFNSIRSVDTPNLIKGVTDSAGNLDILKEATERVSPIDTADGLFANRNGQTVQVFRTGLETSDGTPITPSNIREGIANFLEIARAADKNGA